MLDPLGNWKLDKTESSNSCDLCNGTGETKCDCKVIGNTRVYDCEECGGDGYSGVCSECGGEGYLDCSGCNGTGSDENGDECESCGGSGSESCHGCSGFGRDGECVKCDGNVVLECERCNNTGFYSCPKCGGSGTKRPGKNDIKVDTYFIDKDNEIVKCIEVIDDPTNFSSVKTIVGDNEMGYGFSVEGWAGIKKIITKEEAEKLKNSK